MRHVVRQLLLPLLAVLLLLPPTGLAQETTANTKTSGQDVLVYKNGDRIEGKIISNDGTTIVFQSLRFGFLRVPVGEVQTLSITSGAFTQNQVKAPKPTAAETEFSLRLVQQAIRSFFGQWHGRFSFATEVVHDSDERRNDVFDARLERKWSQDELRLETRYEFSSANDSTSADLLKANAHWRHDLTRRWFLFYRPSLEWNQNYTYEGIPADYRLLINEVGVGFYVIRREGGFIRCGLAENFFNVWTISTVRYIDDNNESGFIEAELQLPWEIRISGRHVRYFHFTGGASGWEQQFELNKKLTSTLSIGLRYEARHNSPDRRVQNYSSWRTLLGFDF